MGTSCRRLGSPTPTPVQGLGSPALRPAGPLCGWQGQRQGQGQGQGPELELRCNKQGQGQRKGPRARPAPSLQLRLRHRLTQGVAAMPLLPRQGPHRGQLLASAGRRQRHPHHQHHHPTRTRTPAAAVSDPILQQLHLQHPSPSFAASKMTFFFQPVNLAAAYAGCYHYCQRAGFPLRG